jgi:uncharacterized cupredoxin-like copper-binding protein
LTLSNNVGYLGEHVHVSLKGANFRMSRIRVVVLGMVAIVAVLAGTLPAAAQSGSASATTVTVTAGSPTEFAFKLSTKSVKAGVVTFKVTNKGQLPHDFKIAGKTTKLLQNGKSQSLKVTLKKGKKYPYLCTVSGHAAAGMKGTVTAK